MSHRRLRVKVCQGVNRDADCTLGFEIRVCYRLHEFVYFWCTSLSPRIDMTHCEGKPWQFEKPLGKSLIYEPKDK